MREASPNLGGCVRGGSVGKGVGGVVSLTDAFAAANAGEEAGLVGEVF